MTSFQSSNSGLSPVWTNYNKIGVKCNHFMQENWFEYAKFACKIGTILISWVFCDNSVTVERQGRFFGLQWNLDEKFSKGVQYEGVGGILGSSKSNMATGGHFAFLTSWSTVLCDLWFMGYFGPTISSLMSVSWFDIVLAIRFNVGVVVILKYCGDDCT